MKFATILLLSLTGAILVQSTHLILGDASKKQLIYHTSSQYRSIPFMKKVKNVFYSSPDQRSINLILAYDNLHTSATATITAGGLGHTYVNIRLKSERGFALDYDIVIYS
ncbi:uncharacterized protein LOC135193547 [Vanessa tameamea]|uniref:Uncharacterized protein LOC135193547 n=1 Tax=Vanessa tameamea TaxID=334116 RepID=A0ABM4AMN9_VANTA